MPCKRSRSLAQSASVSDVLPLLRAVVADEPLYLRAVASGAVPLLRAVAADEPSYLRAAASDAVPLLLAVAAVVGGNAGAAPLLLIALQVASLLYDVALLPLRVLIEISCPYTI